MSGSSAGALVLVFVAFYALLLLAAAWRADRVAARAESDVRRAIVYGLSLALLSSWTYFGAVGAAARTGLGFLPIFLGPILALTVFFPLLRRIAAVVKRENIGTVADFIAARYGKSRVLGPLVTLVTIVGAVPFIAAQLQPLATGWAMITGHRISLVIAMPVIAALLGGFAILFGPRRPLITEHRRGLVRAIALGAVVKLVGLLIAAGIGMAVLVRDPHPARWTENLEALGQAPHFHITFLTATIIAFAGFLCPPRRFYIAFVELENTKDFAKGRWILLAFVLIACASVLPILAAAGPDFRALYPDPDTFVLGMGLRWGGPVLTAFIFLGGFSAAAAVVTAETVALSAMVSNEFVLPFLAHTRWKARRRSSLADDIVGIRRAAIIAILLMSCLYFWAMDHSQTLAKLGMVGLAAMVQLLPALVGAVTWQRGHARGAVWGIAVGFSLWLVGVAMPQLFADKSVLAWLFPFLSGSSIRWEDLNLPVLLSLALNVALYVGISLRTRPSCLDIVQADAFVRGAAPRLPQRRNLAGTAGELRALIGQFIGRESAMHVFGQLGGPVADSDPIDDRLAHTAERFLGGALGSALARRVIDTQFAPLASEAVARVLGEAALAVRFNRELLQTTLDNLSQGVTVVDEELRLVAWNDTYIELFRIPPGFLYAGKPVGDVIAFTARGLGQPEEGIPAYVQKRVEQIRRRQHRAYERRLADGRHLRIVSSPMPGGRYVTSYTDVTELREAAIALHTANEQLEARVDSRTRELTEANMALAAAKLHAEGAAKSQARFLATASHDLLQPLQAARLFIGSYMEGRTEADPEAGEMLANADTALDSADRLLRALLNLSRLEFGAVKPEVRAVEVQALLRELCREFEYAARAKGLALRVVPTRAWVLSDRDLLRSVLQNLVSNAIRYTRTGAVLVGCRFVAGGLRLEVRDSGPGIPEDSQEAIFGEFSRLPRDREFGPGTGLGLSIAKRICTLLGHALTVRSQPGGGSNFAVVLPRGHADPGEAPGEGLARLPSGMRVLCVENDPVVLQGMEALLRKWKVEVSTAQSSLAALSLRGAWDVVIVDYHLEAGTNGLDLIAAMQDRAPVFALLTADQSIDVTERAAILNVEIIRKPVAPLFLRAFLMRAQSLASMGGARRLPVARPQEGELDAQ